MTRPRGGQPVVVASLGALAFIACDGGRAVPSFDTAIEALGQPMGDFPSYPERVVLYASNRARMSPAAEGWPTYPPQPPLQWNVSLNQSSRAHSLDMRDTPCFQHPSCGSATDDTFTRVRTYYTGGARALGENIAGGPSDGITVVHNWIFEIGAAAGETGHRDNLFSPMFNLLGSGYAPGGMPRPAINNFWTQDFVGTPAALAIPRMTDGIHVATVTATAVTFGTTYYDASGAAPDRIVVVVDGTCNPLGLASAGGMTRGSAGKGAYEATLTLTPGCHPYYFLAGSGASAASYPDSGALQVGVGAAAATTCALFVPTREGSSCDTGGPGGGGGGGGSGGGGGGGGPGARGTGGGTPTGTGGAVGGGGGRSPAGGGSGGAASAMDASVRDGIDAGEAGAAGSDGAAAKAGETGCACRAAPGLRGASDLTVAGLVAGGLLAAALRRRRRR